MEERVGGILRDCGLEGADIAEARLYKGEKKLVVTVNCRRLIRAGKIKALEDGLAALMPGCQVEARLSCGGLQVLLEGNDPETLAALRDSWGDILPGARPALMCSEWEYDGGLRVRAPEGLVQLLGREGRDTVREYYRRAYGLEAEISLESDSQLEARLPERAEPEVQLKPKEAPRKDKQKAADKAEVIIGKPIRLSSIIPQRDVDETMGSVTIRGTIVSLETMARKQGGSILTAIISDKTNTLPCKIFLDGKDEAAALSAVEKVKAQGGQLVASGKYAMDMWLRRMCVYPNNLGSMPAERRRDKAEDKRVELHLHTKMSSMDGLTGVKEAIKTAAGWGHRAIAITDHGVVHAFPDAVAQAAKLKKEGKEIKVLLGVEGYLLPDCRIIGRPDEYVAIATTYAPGVKLDEVFEIAALGFSSEGVVTRRLRLVVNGGGALTEDVAAESGLSREEIAAGMPMAEALKRLKDFVRDGVAVLHDPSELDTLRLHGERLGVEVDTRCVSAGTLFHYLHRDCKEAGLAGALGRLSLPCAGKGAMARGEQTAALMTALLKELEERGVTELPLGDAKPREKGKGKRGNLYHIIIIAKNHAGLVNLYRLVSYAHLEHLKKVPRIPRSLLMMHREGLIVGSACEAGELFRGLLEGKEEEELERIARMYDFLEIQPIANNAFLVRNGKVKDEEGLRDLNRRIVALGERMGKPVAATGDVHFLEPEDAIFRTIIMHARGFEDAEEQAPLYFKTTDEMLEEFGYLGGEKAHEVVVDVPNAIADSCDSLKAFLSEKGTYAPTFPGANEELRDMAMARAHEVYGDALPEVVEKRLEKELGSIIGNGYASLYLMAQRLVQKSLSDGYLVGSRGSVGSSFVANMAGITEVNALQPHYVCPECRHSDFDVDRTKYACGVDMPDANCPVCGAQYRKLGYEIPFEVFLGFKGDKTPDIDLNFSGEYQPVAHKFTEVMFGEGHAFRAGTISGVKDKTVYGYVKAYCADNNITINRDETDRLVAGCLGVKKTTGQHPGGIVIVPQEHDIMEFTPVQYPADRSEGDTITTHFDFHAMDDRLVKLDILGHDDPTALRMLHDLTGLDPRSIPLDDKATMGIFSSSEPLGVTLEELECDVGSIAIPEFGTGFVRQMLKDTRPTTMEELVRISGLSHGTDVWLGNAQDLILDGTATLSQVICTRDDIMNYLILRGGDPSMSFKTMENVRKGRGLTPEMEEHMHSINTPGWFIDSCKKIKYMFPRAHAAAYVMMAFRVAYYKVHLPLAFYTAYFTVRADAFDIAQAAGGAGKVLANIRSLKKKGNDMDNKEAELLTILEVVFEMNKRGIELLPVDLYKSKASEFQIEDGKLRPPFSAVAGVGANAALGIAEGAKGGAYTSIENFQARTGANVAVVKALSDMGCLDGLPETDQLSLF